jgi:putative ABC transport system permease protein
VRFADTLGLALSALAQQKVRTLLTTLGVLFGTFVLAASLSIGQGVQETIVREASRHDRLRRVNVWPVWRASESEVPPEVLQVKGDMSDAKRERLRQAIVERWSREHQAGPRVALTRERLGDLAALEHVEAVVPRVELFGWLALGDNAQQGNVSAVPVEDRHLRERLAAGDLFAAPDEQAVLVSEHLLYRWGVADDAAVGRVLGRTVRLEFRGGEVSPGLRLYAVKPGDSPVSRAEERLLNRVVKQLPKALDALDLTPADRALFRKLAAPAPTTPGGEVVAAGEFTIKGVLRLPTPEEAQSAWDSGGDGDVVLPLKAGEDLVLRNPFRAERGFDRATLTVDREENVKEVAGAVRALGLESQAPIEFIERERFQYLLIFHGMACVAAVALLVAALGIANTMLMSVLERTREVGVMKAVGARDRDVQAIFLVEGALIGLAGGALGLLLAWAASFPGDAYLRGMVSRQMKIELTGALFVFPPWLLLGGIAFACLVTTLAAVYPARRAARVNPIAALRHE